MSNKTITETQAAENDHTVSSALEKKIYVLADEVLDILKHLSVNNRHQLNAKLIAERMFIKDSVKKMLGEEMVYQRPVTTPQCLEDNDHEFLKLQKMADAVLDKFSELVPSSLTGEIHSIRSQFKENTVFQGPADWLDSTLSIVKQYIGSISHKNKELRDFIFQTMQYLEATEKYLGEEMSSHQDKFDSDRAFEKDISVNMNMIKNDFNALEDFTKLKQQVFGKIEKINMSIEIKREQDMTRLRETEKTLKAMTKRIADIKEEADEIKKRAEEMEKVSVRDNLTGLYNRMAYDQKIEETLAHYDRYNITASLLVCDIDYFKKINDNLGHNVGDVALKKIASLFTENFRANDFIARYGGEEFAILLPSTAMQGALTAAEGLRKYINNSVFTYKSKRISVTVSIGVSTVRKGDDPASLFERADRALYLAKNSGRNAVKSESDLE